MEYLTFAEVLPLVINEGKKARMVDWQDPSLAFIKMIRTQKFEDNKFEGRHIGSQRFIAIFFDNGGYLPHPYSFPQYDVIGGQWEIVD